MKNKIKWFFIALMTICLLSATMIMFSGCGNKESEDTSVNAPIAGAFALENTPIHTTVNSITDMYIVSGEIQLYLDGRISSRIEAIVQGYTGSNIQTQTNIGTYSWVEGSDKIDVVWNNSPNETVIMSYYGDSLINGMLTYSLTGINDSGELDGKVYQAIYDIENVTDKYNIDGGYLVGKTSQFVNKGADASLVTAIANDGFEFDGWSDGVKEAERRDLSLSGNIHVKAVFRQVEPIYLLEYSAGEGGTLEGKTSQYVVNGRSASQVVATPEEGYEFVRWSDGVTTAERTDTAVAEDITVTAIFEEIDKYTLTYTASLGGYIEGNESQTVQKGESGQTVTAVAYEGYEFVDWSDGVATADRTDTNVTENITVTAIFEEIDKYTLTYTAGLGGYIEGNESQIVQNGESGQTVTAVAYEGYEFVGWSDDVTTAERTDTNVTEDITVTAIFEEIDKYTLSYTAGIGGYIEGNESQTVQKGESGQTVTAVAYEGYEFVGWSDDVATAERTDTNVTEDVTVTAIFEEINTTQFAGGSGSIGNPYKISTIEQMNNMLLYPNAHYILINDITLPQAAQNTSNFTSLFNGETMFNGSLNGNGHTIYNLTIYNINTFYTGLFACIGVDGSVTNLTLENVNLQGTNYIGGIAGYALGEITDCKVSGKIIYIPQNSYKIYLGGIAGRAENNVNGCTSSVEIIADGVNGETYVGGIVGYYSYGMGKSETSFTVVSSVNISLSANENNRINGYLGGVFGESSETISIINSRFDGNITADGLGHTRAGGLIGYCSSGTFSSCYSTGEIYVTNVDSAHVGGLTGCCNISGTFSSCYTTGDITVTTASYSLFVGGITGDGWGTFSSCYTTGEIYVMTAGSAYVGGIAGDGRGTFSSCYTTGEIYVTAGDRAYFSEMLVGGLIGRSDTFSTIFNSYTTAQISFEGEAQTKYIGSIVGQAGELTINNTHWLYYIGSGVEYAVGYSSDMGIPTSIGSTKHTDIADFYTLADALNKGLETPVWENIGNSSLPTLKKENN